MIDIHAHILPGVDDGARSMEETLAMLDEACAAGITRIIATPHVNRRFPSQEAARKVFRSVEAAAAERGIALTLGAELNIAIAMATENIRPLCFQMEVNGVRCLLLELEPQTRQDEAMAMVDALAREDILPILAHPERYPFVQRNVRALMDVRALGGMIQMDAEALDGRPWDMERRTARRMLKDGLVDCVASDAHRIGDYKRFAAALREMDGFENAPDLAVRRCMEEWAAR